LQEFYTTEITYWNQLNYIKVMYYDPLELAIQRNSPFVQPSDMDWFSNLSELMEFSLNIIYQLQHYQQHFISNSSSCSDCQEIQIGKILCDMAESMSVFLHCALDYQANRKLMSEKKNNKGYMLYKDKLSLKRETRQFTLQDYLIVPIQRITRYGLLLADLEKHTEADDPDYKHIQIGRDIIHSLALAMNYAQK
ncbi:Dbl homology domain-containing protein, partial [Backusella circina FSU 941]